MLRRYTSLGLQNHQLVGPTALLGSSNLCDIIVKGTHVSERHALIEYHPITRSYWIRDLGTLGGTYLNDNVVYGMTELKSADILRFGKSAEYIFDMPPIQPSPERRPSNMRHSHCAEAPSDGIALPIVGNRIFLKNGNERFSRAPNQKKLCLQEPPPPLTRSSDSDGTPKKIATSQSSKNIRPISVKQRSLSLGRSATTSAINGMGKLPSLKMPSGSSSGYSSTEKAFLAQFSSAERKGGGNKNSIGNQLLQRVVRLQHELKRKDEEISKLKENAILPSTTGERVKGHLDEYRIALAEVKAENEKLRAILSQDHNVPPPMDNVLKEMNERVTEAEHAKQLQEIVFQTFFTVTVTELEDINKTVSLATIRDYSDIISEVVKLLQDPFSFKLMEISAKCNRSFNRENVTKEQKEELAKMFDKFLKQTIYPLSKALDTFLPIVKDTAVMARESARACTIFSQWSREFGDAIIREGLTWEIMIYKAEELNTRFRENGIPKHWLPPSIVPLFKTIVEQFKRQVPRHHSFATDTSRSDPAASGILRGPEIKDEAALAILKTEVEQKSAELKKTKTKVIELRQLIDQLHNEKEDLISQLSSMEDKKFDLGKSGLRGRRSANPTETPPIPITVPRIHLQESEDTEVDPELNRGNTPEELSELIEQHETQASPPSEVSEENTIDEFERLEDESSNKLEKAGEISGGDEADDEISIATPRVDDGEKYGIEEELVDGESVKGEGFHDDENESNPSHNEREEEEGVSNNTIEENTEGEEQEEANDENASQKITPRNTISGGSGGDAGENENENIDGGETMRTNKTQENVDEQSQNEDSEEEITERGSKKSHYEESLKHSGSEEEKALNEDGENNEEESGGEVMPEATNENDITGQPPKLNELQNQEKTIIEFWHLATALSNLLRLKVPEEDEIVDEHERRKTTLDKILEEMEKLLVQLREKAAAE